MGFMTSLYILNDGIDVIEKNPEQFVAEVARRAKSGRVDSRWGTAPEVGQWAESFAVGNFANPAGVIEVAHADLTQVILVGGNTANLLGATFSRDISTKEGIKKSLNHVLDRYGLKVINQKAKVKA